MTSLSIRTRTLSLSRSISVHSPTTSPSVPTMLHTATRRCLHTSRIQNAIMMPAMSPLMTEGAITRWFKKEGEAFKAGEAILEIESDIYRISVEAENPGIMGRILVPAGTEHVPVEQVLAIVAKDPEDLNRIQAQSRPSENTNSTVQRSQSLSSHLRPRAHLRSQSIPQPGMPSPQTPTFRGDPSRPQSLPQSGMYSPQTPTLRGNMHHPPRPRSPAHPPLHVLTHAPPSANAGMQHVRDMHSASSTTASPITGLPEQIKEVQNTAADVRRTIVSSLMNTGTNARGNYFDGLL